MARRKSAPKQASAGRPGSGTRSPAHLRVRRAHATKDLDAIVELEQAAFQDYRQASLGSLRRSLTSAHQSFWVIDFPGVPGKLAGLLVLWHFPKTWRVYDIATHPEARGQGIGTELMQHAESLARKAGATRMSLEAEEQDARLVAWYVHQGYTVVDRLEAFYHNGCSALRLTKHLGPQA